MQIHGGARLHRGVRRSRASIVTRRCWRSAKVPARSCGSSSRGISAPLPRTEPADATGNVLRARRRRRPPVGTEAFRCAPGAHGLAVLQRDRHRRPLTASRDRRHRGRRRLAYRSGADRHRRARHPARAERATRSPASAIASRSRSRGDPQMHLDYFTPATNAITAERLTRHDGDRRRLPRAGHAGGHARATAIRAAG